MSFLHNSQSGNRLSGSLGSVRQMLFSNAYTPLRHPPAINYPLVVTLPLRDKPPQAIGVQEVASLGGAALVQEWQGLVARAIITSAIKLLR